MGIFNSELPDPSWNHFLFLTAFPYNTFASHCRNISVITKLPIKFTLHLHDGIAKKVPLHIQVLIFLSNQLSPSFLKKSPLPDIPNDILLMRIIYQLDFRQSPNPNAPDTLEITLTSNHRDLAGLNPHWRSSALRRSRPLALVYLNIPCSCYMNRNHQADEWRIICSREEKLYLRLRLPNVGGWNQNP